MHVYELAAIPFSIVDIITGVDENNAFRKSRVVTTTHPTFISSVFGNDEPAMKNRPPFSDSGNGFLNFTVALISRDKTGLSDICKRYRHASLLADSVERLLTRVLNRTRYRATASKRAHHTHLELDVRFPDAEVVLPEILVVRVHHVRQTRYVENVLAFHVVTIVEIRQCGLHVFDVRPCSTHTHI